MKRRKRCALCLRHAKETKDEKVCVDYRLFVEGRKLCFTMMDLTSHYDPTTAYETQHPDDPARFIGVRMVTKMATEVRYFSTFDNNNLLISIDQS